MTQQLKVINYNKYSFYTNLTYSKKIKDIMIFLSMLLVSSKIIIRVDKQVLLLLFSLNYELEMDKAYINYL